MKTSRIIALILAAAIAVSACAMLTGCGDDKKDNTKATTAPTAAAATTAATSAAAGQDAAAETQAQADNGNSAESATTAEKKVDDDGYIDEATAIANVKQLAGSGAQIISSEKGYSPEGFEAWVIVVAPVTTNDGPETVTYYSGYQFCYAEENAVSYDSSEIGIDQETAVANVKQQAGSGAQIISVEEGTSPEGFPAYVIVVAPVTASEEAVYDTYYSGYLFCYKETSGED